jgi:hypothetical protein
MPSKEYPEKQLSKIASAFRDALITTKKKQEEKTCIDGE